MRLIDRDLGYALRAVAALGPGLGVALGGSAERSGQLAGELAPGGAKLGRRDRAQQVGAAADRAEADALAALDVAFEAELCGQASEVELRRGRGLGISRWWVRIPGPVCGGRLGPLRTVLLASGAARPAKAVDALAERDCVTVLLSAL